MTITRNTLLGLLGLVLAGCHDKDPVGGIPTPCAAQAANPLTFSFLEGTGTATPDTAAQGDVSFVGPGAPYTSWQWVVGNDTTIHRQQKFSLFFNTDVVGNTLPVRLIARRPPNLVCFPHDDGVDTLSKPLTIAEYNGPGARILGRYLGANRDAPGDTFSVRIYRHLFYSSPANGYFTYLGNLVKGCQSPNFTVTPAYRAISFSFGDVDFGCLPVGGTAKLNTAGDSVIIQYKIGSSSYHTFGGKRVH